MASAAIDVSDGLLADAAHIADASEVAIDIDCHRLPLSDALRALPDQDQSLRWAFRGDDYELLFTLPPDSIVPAGCTEIGRVVAGSGVSCAVTPQQSGMTISQTDAPDAARAQIDGLATLIASGLGSGLSPFAPGTVGSLFTALCLLPSLGVAATIHWWAWSGAVCVAIWSAEEAGRRWGWWIIPRS